MVSYRLCRALDPWFTPAGLAKWSPKTPALNTLKAQYDKPPSGGPPTVAIPAVDAADSSAGMDTPVQAKIDRTIGELPRVADRFFNEISPVSG